MAGYPQSCPDSLLYPVVERLQQEGIFGIIAWNNTCHGNDGILDLWILDDKESSLTSSYAEVPTRVLTQVAKAFQVVESMGFGIFKVELTIVNSEINPEVSMRISIRKKS